MSIANLTRITKTEQYRYDHIILSVFSQNVDKSTVKQTVKIFALIGKDCRRISVFR